MSGFEIRKRARDQRSQRWHMATSATFNLLNFNIGVLGHVDSGKTSLGKILSYRVVVMLHCITIFHHFICLAKVLSTVASTASFDKHPQSQERGITLDLGK